MCKNLLALLVDDDQRGHATHLQPFDLLTVKIGHLVIGIGQPDKWQVFLLPILFERARTVGADCDDLRIPPDKFLVVLAQLRHVPAAVRSHESPVEDQHDVFFAAII